MIADIKERLAKSFLPEPNSGCWLWFGGWNSDGYGYLGGRGVHCLSYEAYVGAIPEGLHLDHLCRMPCCINPRHLEPVTPMENVRRGAAGKLLNRDCCEKGHPFTPENTYFRRPRRTSDNPTRICKICHSKNRRKYYLNHGK